MANLGNIVYLSEAQKDALFANGTITANGTTVTYNPNDLYVTPDNGMAVSSESIQVTNGNLTLQRYGKLRILQIECNDSDLNGTITLAEGDRPTVRAFATVSCHTGASPYNYYEGLVAVATTGVITLTEASGYGSGSSGWVSPGGLLTARGQISWFVA